MNSCTHASDSFTNGRVLESGRYAKNVGQKEISNDDLLVVQLLVDKALEQPQVDHAEHLQ